MSRCALVIGSVGLLAAASTAQSPRLPSFASLRDAVSIEAERDVLLASGWDYRARIDSAGLSFTPALGSEVEQPQCLQLRAIDFGRESQRVAAGAAAPVRDQGVVHLARAGGAFERFEVQPEGVAISWRFDRPLAGVGDLVVRYRVGSTLPHRECSPVAARFHVPGVGGVAIGAVTGIDADGRRVAGELRLDNDVLEMRLPAAFVEEAVYPLVLDPLVSTEFLATPSAAFNDTAPDAAYDVTNDTWLVVYRRVFAATSQAIRAQRLDGSGGLVGNVLSVRTAVQVNHPCVANVNLRDTFVVAWQEAGSPFSDHCIQARSIAAATGAMSTVVCLMATTLGNFTNPDISGNKSTNTEGAYVVYEAEGAGVGLAHLSVPATGAAPTVVSTATVANSALAQWPAISASNSQRARVVTYQQGIILGAELRAQAIDSFGSPVGNAVTVASGQINQAVPGRSAVDGDGIDFVVAYEVDEPGASFGERDVFCRGLRWNFFTSTLSTTTAATPIAVTPGIDQREPAVGHCRDKLLVTCAEQVLTGAANFDVRGFEVLPDCSSCGAPIVLTGINGTLLRSIELMPAVASEFGGGADSDRGLVVFAEADHAPPFSSSVIAQRYEAMVGGDQSIVGLPCGTAGSIASNGPFAVGNSQYEVSLVGVPSGGLPLLAFGLVGGELSCGPCLVVSPLVLEFAPPVGGVAAFPWPMPCAVASAVGSTLQLQWIVLDSGSSPCSAFPAVSFSSRLVVTLDF